VNDVLPVLSKVGCNQGACHGARAGKGGFRLSLRGYAPELDYLAITHDLRGRRINRSHPEASLLLRKPLGQLPHMGGRLLAQTTPEYQILRDWIAAGAPGPRHGEPRPIRLEVPPPVLSFAGVQAFRCSGVQPPGITGDASQDSLAPAARSSGHQVIRSSGHQLQVRARFSDRSLRDVTHWARYATNNNAVATVDEAGRVTGVGPGATAISIIYQDQVAFARVEIPFLNRVEPRQILSLPRRNFIDDLVLGQLARLRLPPSPFADDATFLRRVTLDTIGLLPTPEEVRAFVADQHPAKRERLVDALLARPEFVDFWTLKWSDLLRVNRQVLGERGMWAFHQYLRESVAANKPWDQLARELLTARGDPRAVGAANFYRIAPTPGEAAEAVAGAFLGIRLGCARCHNHPRDRWTQDNYYEIASFFARVSVKKEGTGSSVVFVKETGDIAQPRLGRPLPPRAFGSAMVLALDTPGDRREALARWLTAPENDLFARAIVNRIWRHFLGLGLVEPVDDMRATSPASNEPLMAALCADLVRHQFDLKRLMRLILTSRTYQLSSRPTPENAADDRHYSRFFARRLTAEQLADALGQVTGRPETYSGVPEGFRAAQLPDTTIASELLDAFGRPPRSVVCECERSAETTMPQALLLLNGAAVNEKLGAEGGTLRRLLAAHRDDPPVIDALYLLAYSRTPAPAERATHLAAIRRAIAARPSSVTANDARREAFEDLLWALINSREFLFNH
jgi:hypothetical protein